jgi:hypothetical protein
MISREQILDVVCAQNSGLAAQKAINTLAKYESGNIYINCRHNVIQEVNILVLQQVLFSVINSPVLFLLSKLKIN